MLDLRMDCLRMDCSYKIKASTHKDLYPLKHLQHCHNFEDKINMFRKKCTEFSFLMDVKRRNICPTRASACAVHANASLPYIVNWPTR